MGICVSRLMSILGKVLHADDLLLPSPDRWDNLPEAVKSLPGLYANTLTFSAGPRVRFFGHNALLCGAG
jgi:hypothetical protein